jgi:hypothetical protein
MRLQDLTVAVLLGVGSWTMAQTTSSSSSQQQLPLPSAPRSPKSSAECDAYQKQIDDQMAQVSQRHSACLDSFKADQQGDNDLVCSRSECQSLHTLLYGPRNKAGEQQVASCQAAVQRYQARSAAQQQGIQTLGNAIGDLLAPSPSTPIDSQNDLASYEDQQKGQAVLGDDSTTSSSPDDAATNLMNSGVPDSGPSVQSQLDSVTDSALAGDSTTAPSPMPTPRSGPESATSLPSPVPGPLPPPDPSVATYTGLNISPQAFQVLKGVGQIGTACGVVAAACLADVPTGGLGTVGVVFAVQGAAGTFVAGTANIVSGFSGDPTFGQQSEKVINAVKNPAGQVVTMFTGDLNSGANAANIADGLVSFGTLPGTQIPGHLGLSLFNANQAASSLEDATVSIQNSLPSSPPASAHPSPMPTPPMPSQSANNGQVYPTPQPAPPPAPNQSTSPPN